MKINIQSKVVSCNDIGSSVKRYLCHKARQHPLSFLPFEVEKIAVAPRKASLAEYKESLMAVVNRNNTPALRYQKSSRKTERTPRTSNTNRRNQPLNESSHRDETMLHSFYAQSLLGERRAQTAYFSKLRRRNLRLSNLANEHNPRVSTFEVADMQYQLTAGPKTYTRARRTMGNLYSVLYPMTYRTCLGAPPKRHVAVDSRMTLGFSHNPFTNLFEFSYKHRSSVGNETATELPS